MCRAGDKEVLAVEDHVTMAALVVGRVVAKKRLVGEKVPMGAAAEGSVSDGSVNDGRVAPVARPWHFVRKRGGCCSLELDEGLAGIAPACPTL